MTEWLTEEQAADWLKLPVEVVREAVQGNELPALIIKNHVRISSQALLTLGAHSDTSTHNGTAETPAAEVVPAGDGRLPPPTALTWLNEIAPAPAFTIPWPKKGGGTHDEAYPQAWSGLITLNGDQVEVKVGECIRDGRGRLTVMFDRTPICEFVATVDGQNWASIIKPDGKHVLAVGQTPPRLYRGARVEPYRDVTGMTGTGVPKGLAVVVSGDDYRSTVHHAAARWLGKHRFPVDPA